MMIATDGDTPPAARAPDWSAVDQHPPCPLCGYDLFGLDIPRCPECGYRGDWAELLDPQRREHPYLFEHHPESNIRSYWRTVFGALRPRTFWSSLHPVQPSRRGRLLLYWAIGACFYLIALAASCVFSVWAFYHAMVPLWWTSGTPQGFVSGMVLSYVKIGLSWDLLLWGGLPLCVPWIAWLSLMIFRISMRRARVKGVHVLRCVLYSFDPSAWTVLTAAACISTAVPLLLGLVSRDYSDEVGFVLAPLWGTFLFYRMVLAYRLYMRLDHPVATVAASFVIMLLIVANLYFLFTLWL